MVIGTAGSWVTGVQIVMETVGRTDEVVSVMMEV